MKRVKPSRPSSLSVVQAAILRAAVPLAIDGGERLAQRADATHERVMTAAMGQAETPELDGVPA